MRQVITCIPGKPICTFEFEVLITYQSGSTNFTFLISIVNQCKYLQVYSYCKTWGTHVMGE